MGTNCLQPQWQTLAFPEAFYEKAIVLYICKVFFFFLSLKRMFTLLCKKEQKVLHLHISACPSAFLLSSFIAWLQTLKGWRRVCCFFGALSPTFWGTARLQHIGRNSFAGGAGGKAALFYLFIHSNLLRTDCVLEVGDGERVSTYVKS